MATSEQQLVTILKITSIPQKCNELSNNINTSRNLLNLFKPIVEDIFNHELDNWKLKTLTRATSSNDCDAVISFLHPEGIFFALIKSLMTETSAKFEFPASHFPPYFRSMIENGTAPPFFANKIISTSFVSASHLILNPFEFYMFNFGLYILDGAGFNCDSSITVNNEPVYFSLLKIYLNYFVPLDSNPRSDHISPFMNTNQQNSLWQSLSSTTTSILNLATPSNASNQNMPSLFKSSIFQPQTPFNQTTSNYMSSPSHMLYGQGEHLGSIEWRCSTVVLMLTELWFGNIPAPKTNYILRSAALDDLSISNIQPYSANTDQMTAVRIMIKHLHNFSNSFTYSPVSHAGNQGLAEIKQAIWTIKYPLQKRLYTFIKVAFNRWPMDYTFRQPLEAWLSYIQPWRYVRMGSECQNEMDDLDGNRSSTLVDVPSVDNHWRNFISDNLLYYTVIFSLFIDRLLQLDLSSSRNALMLFRVIKVYSQPGFLLLLKEAEEAVFRNNIEQNISSSKSPHKISTPNRTINDPNISNAKLLAPVFMASGRVSTPKTRIGALEHHLLNLERDSDFNYVSLFSPQTSQQLSKLFVAIQKSRLAIKDFIQSVEARSEVRNRGWLDSIWAFISFEDACFESKDEREMYKDKIQAEDYLNFASTKITQCFEVQVPDLDLTNNVNSQGSSNRRIFFNY